jgi:hypothetical protein
MGAKRAVYQREVGSMRKLVIVVVVFVGIVVAYVLAHLALIEIGQEVVVVHKRYSDGSVHEARLWIVDAGEYAWLHHGYAGDDWILHLAVQPIIEVERGGQTLQYRAQPDAAADPKVHQLLREKYGFADRLVRFWAGTDTEKGLATGTTCTAIPVRLERSGSPETPR